MSDAGMTAAELHAFREALLHETNPSHLFGFASALAPDHCTSASFLHARGTLLDKRRLLGPAAFTHTMGLITSLALETEPPRTAPHTLLAARRALDEFARNLHVPPAILHRKARQSAGEMIMDEHAVFADVPHVIIAIARPLVLSVGPVRVLDPSAVRLALAPTTGLTSFSEAEDRARWVRHYAREARRTTTNRA